MFSKTCGFSNGVLFDLWPFESLGSMICKDFGCWDAFAVLAQVKKVNNREELQSGYAEAESLQETQLGVLSMVMISLFQTHDVVFSSLLVEGAAFFLVFLGFTKLLWPLHTTLPGCRRRWSGSSRSWSSPAERSRRTTAAARPRDGGMVGAERGRSGVGWFDFFFFWGEMSDLGLRERKKASFCLGKMKKLMNILAVLMRD